MKLLKIGSSSSSNIVLNSEFVSSHHAEILLLDSGKSFWKTKTVQTEPLWAARKLLPTRKLPFNGGIM